MTDQTAPRAALAPQLDRRLDYGPTWPNGGDKGSCRLRAFFDQHVVVLSELDDNPGMSITNAAEAAWTVASAVLDSPLELPPWTMVEHYPHTAYRHLPATFDVVRFAGRDGKGQLQRPLWAPAGREVGLLAWLEEACRNG